jgi:hypothetical protein
VLIIVKKDLEVRNRLAGLFGRMRLSNPALDPSRSIMNSFTISKAFVFLASEVRHEPRTGYPQLIPACDTQYEQMESGYLTSHEVTA